MPSAIWDLDVNPSRSLVGPVTTLANVPHTSGRTGHWEFDVDQARHRRLGEERAAMSLLQMCSWEISRTRVDPTGGRVAFAFRVIERLAADAIIEMWSDFSPGLGSIDVEYQMRVATF